MLIAVIDDDGSVRQALTALIRSLGFRSEGFASGEAFLQWSRIPEVDCIVTDIHMPILDGVELKMRFEQVCEPVPVIMITASDHHDLTERVHSAKPFALLHKPFRAVELEEALLRASRSRNG